MRDGSPADVPAILELITAAYAGANVTSSPDYWQWKHQDNPFGESPVLLAEANGQLVGVRAFMRWEWRSENRDVSAVRAVDTATRPDWQGKRIFSMLTRALVERVNDDGIGFIFNTPNQKSMPGYLKMGWDTVGRVPIWVCPVRPLAIAAALMGRRRSDPPDLLSLPPAHEVVGAPEVIERLVDLEPNDRRYHTRRTGDYLAWRYSPRSGIDYRALCERRAYDLAVVVCRGRIRAGLREITICELLMTRSSGGVRLARRLLRQLAAAVGTADLMTAIAPKQSRERAALGLAGFVPTPPMGPWFTAYPMNVNDPPPLSWASWRPSIGDLELF